MIINKKNIDEMDLNERFTIFEKFKKEFSDLGEDVSDMTEILNYIIDSQILIKNLFEENTKLKKENQKLKKLNNEFLKEVENISTNIKKNNKDLKLFIENFGI